MSVVIGDEEIPAKYTNSINWITTNVSFEGIYDIDTARATAKAKAKELASRRFNPKTGKAHSSIGMERVLDSTAGTAYLRRVVTRNINARQQQLQDQAIGQGLQSMLQQAGEVKPRVRSDGHFIDTADVVL